MRRTELSFLVGPRRRRRAARAAVVDMLHTYSVSTLKSTAIGFPLRPVYRRMPILIAVVDVRTPMVAKIFSGPFNAIVKAASLRLSKLPWRHIPWPRLLHIRRHRGSRQSDWTSSREQARYCYNWCNLPKSFHHSSLLLSTKQFRLERYPNQPSGFVGCIRLFLRESNRTAGVEKTGRKVKPAGNLADLSRGLFVLPVRMRWRRM